MDQLWWKVRLRSWTAMATNSREMQPSRWWPSADAAHRRTDHSATAATRVAGSRPANEQLPETHLIDPCRRQLSPHVRQSEVMPRRGGANPCDRPPRTRHSQHENRAGVARSISSTSYPQRVGRSHLTASASLTELSSNLKKALVSCL